MQSVAYSVGWTDNIAKMPYIYKRLAKGQLCSWAPLICMVLGGVAGALLSATGEPRDWPVGLMFGVFLGQFVGVKFCQHCSVTALGAGIVLRGAPERLDYAVEAAPHGLSWRSDRSASTVQWVAVTEVNRLDRDWVFLCDNIGLFVPRAGFASPDAERAFLTEALSHMSDEARARSKTAVAFAFAGAAA